MRTSFDAAVCGAGPAGSYLAWLLASQGIRTVLIDKAAFPRYKVCGGGLTRRAMDLLPFDLSGVVEDLTVRATIGLRRGLPIGIGFEEPVIGMVMRDRFDFFLAEKAASAGAVFIDRSAIRSVGYLAGRVSVCSTRGDFSARVAVGADGVHSMVRRSLGFPPNRAVPALEAELVPGRGELPEGLRGGVDFDFWAIPKGYGWVFPKRDHLSAGVFSTGRTSPGMRGSLHAYIRAKGLDEGFGIRSLRGHLIPTGPPAGGRVTAPGCLLVGDAAGCADPVTGEGIYHALRQAILASGAIRRHLDGDGDALADYERAMHKEFFRELVPARRLAFLLYGVPFLSDRLMAAIGDKIMRCHIDVISGRRSYREVFREAIQPANLVGGLRPGCLAGKGRV